MKATKTNTVHLTRDEMTALRSLALAFGLTVPKGPGAGELGNVRALLASFARAYQEDPDFVIAQLAPLVHEEEHLAEPAFIA